MNSLIINGVIKHQNLKMLKLENGDKLAYWEFVIVSKPSKNVKRRLYLSGACFDKRLFNVIQHSEGKHLYLVEA